MGQQTKVCLPFALLGGPGTQNASKTSPRGFPNHPKAPFLMIWGRLSGRSLIILGRCVGSKFDDLGSIFSSMFCSMCGSKADFLTPHSPNSRNVSELPGSLQGQTMGASSEGGGQREVSQMPRTCTGHGGGKAEGKWIENTVCLEFCSTTTSL